MASAALGASGLAYTVPPGWKASAPTSSMRVAEFTLPRAAGDIEDAELVVYYFGGQGGSVEANINRWTSQVRRPDGQPSTAVPRREQRSVHGLAVTLVDVAGRYIAETMPGSGRQVDKPHYRLRAGVVETPRGPYFIKLTGPEKTVARWEQAFDTFIGSLNYQG